MEVRVRLVYLRAYTAVACRVVSTEEMFSLEKNPGRLELRCVYTLMFLAVCMYVHETGEGILGFVGPGVLCGRVAEWWLGEIAHATVYRAHKQ